MVGQPFAISEAPGAQTLEVFSVAFDGTNYLVAWMDYRNEIDGDGSCDPNEGTCADIYGQFVSPSGTLVGPEIAISTQPFSEKLVDVAFDGNRYLLAWTCRRNSTTSDHDVYGCYVTPSGTKTAAFAISETPSPRYNPLGIAVGNGGCLVVWNKDVGPGEPSPSEWDVYGRLISTSGTFLTPEFAIASAAGSQIVPRVAYDGTRYLVVWTEDIGDSSQSGNIKGRFISDSGTFEGSEFPIYVDDVARVALPLVGANGKFLMGSMEGDILSGTITGLYGSFITNDSNSTSSAKANPNGFSVALGGQIVTYIDPAPSNIMYIQDPKRTSGIRVSAVSLPAISVGNVVNVFGVLATTDGEKVIADALVEPTGTTAPARPLGMPNKSLGGGNFSYDSQTGAGQIGVTGGSGLNNIGLLVRTTGSCARVDDHTFTITDGSGAPVTCVTQSTILTSPAWQYAAVTGISSIAKNGETFERLIRVTGVEPMVSQPSEGITGRWEMTSASGGLSGVLGMLLVQQESAVSGGVCGNTILNGQVSGNTFTATWIWDPNGYNETFALSLTIDGDTLSGTFTNITEGHGYPPVTFHRVSTDPVSPYVGRPRVIAATCDGSSVDVTWDRPIHGYDRDILDPYGYSIVTEWDGSVNSYDHATHTFHMPLPASTQFVPGQTYTICLESGDYVDWHDPYGVPAWDTDADGHSFLYTAPQSMGVNFADYFPTDDGALNTLDELESIVPIPPGI